MSNVVGVSSETSRKKFTPEEDAKLKELVSKIGAKKWLLIAKSMPGRTGRQCRDRFQNYLSPKLTNGPWTIEDDLLLISKVKEYGSSWSRIVHYFPGRSTNNVKNRYNIHLAKFNLDVDKFLTVTRKNNKASNAKKDVKPALHPRPASVLDKTMLNIFNYGQNIFDNQADPFDNIEVFTVQNNDVFSSWI